MNRHDATVRFTGSIILVGVVPKLNTPVNPGPPPARGQVRMIEIELTGGASTLCTTRLIEGASGHILYESIGDAFPPSGILRLQPFDPIHYVGAPAPNQLQLEVTTDDGTNTSSVNYTLEIEGA